MQKNVFTCVLAVCIITAACPAEQEQISPHELSFSMQLDVNRDRDIKGMLQTLTYEFSKPHLSAAAGISLGYENISLTANAVWIPLKLRLFSLGPQIGYNTDIFTGYSIEHNFIIGGRLTAGRIDRVLLTAECAYLLKLTDFYRLRQTIPLLADNSLAVSLTLSSIIRDRLIIGFKIYSYDMFNYPLFFVPSYKLQLGWVVTPQFSIGGSIAVQYSDMFTLTSYLSKIMTGFAIRYKIPPAGNI